MSTPLATIEGAGLPASHQVLLRPGRSSGAAGLPLPNVFYVVESWRQARETKLTANFTLAELMAVDCREADLLLRCFPHYVPCAVSILARYLEEFRTRVEAPVLIAVNGGYRSPAHSFSEVGSAHQWGVAADIYRIGDTWLDSRKSIERYGRTARTIGQEVVVKPFGSERGQTDDHLHFELGRLLLEPPTHSPPCDKK